jgi:hypothetical protein
MAARAICIRVVLPAVLALLLTAPSFAQTVGISTDVSVDLSGSVLDDESAAHDEGPAGFTPEAIGSIPNHTDVAGFHPLSNGDKLISFDTTVELPGGLRAEPADVILWDGSSYSVDFDGRAAGIRRRR